MAAKDGRYEYFKQPHGFHVSTKFFCYYLADRSGHILYFRHQFYIATHSTAVDQHVEILCMFIFT